MFILNNDAPTQVLVPGGPSAPPAIGRAANTATQTEEKRGGARLEQRGHILHAVAFLGPPFAHYLLEISTGTQRESVSMEGAKGEERSAEQAASLFGTPEVESQTRNTGAGKNKWKILTGVCFDQNSYLSNPK